MVSMLPPRNPLRPPCPRLPGLFPTRILSPGCVIATAFAPDSGVLSTMVVCDAPKTTSEVGEEFSAHEGRGRARPLPDIQVRCLRAWGHAGPAVPSLRPAQRVEEAGLHLALGVPFALGSRGAWYVRVRGQDQASGAWSLPQGAPAQGVTIRM